MQDNRFMNTAAAQSAQIDTGLRSYMLGVYNHMTTALLLTGFFCFRHEMGGYDRSCCWPDGLRHTIKVGRYAGTAWHGFLAFSPHE